MIQNHQFAILLPLAGGAGAVECTIFIHALAVTTTVNLFRYERRRGRLGAHALNNLAILALVISVAFVAHLVEIGLWAVLLVLCGEFQELGSAYYHPAVNYATLGYGDVLMTPRGVCWVRWRRRTEPQASYIRMPLARIASASSAAGPLKVLPAPSRTISVVPRSGRP
jgi:hypothetical protein